MLIQNSVDKHPPLEGGTKKNHVFSPLNTRNIPVINASSSKNSQLIHFGFGKVTNMFT